MLNGNLIDLMQAVSKPDPTMALLKTLGFSLLVLNLTGVVVVQSALTPLPPKYFHADRDTVARLQCPGVQSSPTQVTTVDWFRGNQSAAAVQLDDRVKVDSTGHLAIQDSRASDGGWYSCKYTTNNGGLVAGKVHLNVVGAYLDLYILNPDTGAHTTLPDAQNTVINLPPNLIVVMDAKTSIGDDIRVRNPYFLHEGENANLRRPYFCYTGYPEFKGDFMLRMVMLTSHHNFSGYYELVAGGLRTSVNLTIRDDGKPVEFLTPEKETEVSVNCNDAFRTLLVTLPAATTTTTTTRTVTTASTPPTARSPVAGEPKFVDGDGTAGVTVTATTAPAVLQSVIKPSASLTLVVACTAGGFLLILILAVLLLYRRSRSKTEDKEEDSTPAVARLAYELPPRTLPNNSEDMSRKPGMFAQPGLLQAAFPLSRSNDTSAAHGSPAPMRARGDGCRYEYVDMTYRTASASGGMSRRHSHDSLLNDALMPSAHTPSPAFRTNSQATMLSGMPVSEAYETLSLRDIFAAANLHGSINGGGGGESTPLAHGARSTELLKVCLERTASGRLVVSPVRLANSEHLPSVPGSCPPLRRNISLSAAATAASPQPYDLATRFTFDLPSQMTSSRTPSSASSSLAARCPNCSSHSRCGSASAATLCRRLLLSEAISASTGDSVANAEDEFYDPRGSVAAADDEEARYLNATSYSVVPSPNSAAASPNSAAASPNSAVASPNSAAASPNSAAASPNSAVASPNSAAASPNSAAASPNRPTESLA